MGAGNILAIQACIVLGLGVVFILSQAGYGKRFGNPPGYHGYTAGFALIVIAAVMGIVSAALPWT